MEILSSTTKKVWLLARFTSVEMREITINNAMLTRFYNTTIVLLNSKINKTNFTANSKRAPRNPLSASTPELEVTI
jgi:hypothetical protein